AVAGFQVDAGCPTLPAEDCEDRASDWYQWVTDPDLLADASTHTTGDPLSDGPGWRELYAEDLARAADELHNNGTRFSIEWSRLFPDGAAEAATTVDELYDYADADGVAYVHDILDAAEASGLTPLVTLSHGALRR
ncbi:MAG: family 1 glycosylhydrolase, partial [Myxococcales bacterium]|nr:family 1 glycosylhydrolase [Myxococcales bacterium]